MNLGNAIKMAFKSLKASKMRTFLTMLGVIIGVLTVALLTTVTDGATSTVINSLKKESTISMILVQKPTTVANFNSTILSAKESDGMGEFSYSVVVKNSGNVNNAIIKVPAGNSQYYKRDVATQTSIYGVDSNYNVIRNLQFDGRWIEDVNEIVVDRDFIDIWFGEDMLNENVLGQTVTLGGTNYVQITILVDDEIEAQQCYAILRSALTTTTSTTNPETGETTKIPAYSSVEIDAFDETVNFVDGKMVLYVVPNSFYADDQLKTIIVASLSSVLSQEKLASTGIVDYFDSTGAKEYTIVGVAKEDDSAFSLTSMANNMQSSIGSMTEEFAALSEAMERGAKGNVYMLIDNANLSVLRADDGVTDADDLIINGAYLRYADENDVGSGNIIIMMKFMEQGYEIMKDIMPVSMDSVAAIIDQSMSILTIMLTVIASISLVVGGIGIMNIMLVAVSERTREIGIRKAIGAKTSSILTQFLVEALVVSLLGGIIGLVLSFIGSLIIGSVMGISLIMPLWVIGMSVGFCLVIGVVFGMYPAIKASRLQPIDALRRD